MASSTDTGKDLSDVFEVKKTWTVIDIRIYKFSRNILGLSYVDFSSEEQYEDWHLLYSTSIATTGLHVQV